MWLSGLWGWGEADQGEWQVLYRVEGARRALKAAIAEAEEQRRLVLAWDEQEARGKVLAAARAAAMRAAYNERRLEDAERERWIVADAQKRVTPRTVWAAWAWSTGMRQRDIGNHLGVSGGVVGQECHKYVTAFWPGALNAEHGRVCVNVQQVLQHLFRGKPEPPRPSEWRELPRELPVELPVRKLPAAWSAAGASAAEWRDISRERHRWVYERRAEGWTLQQIGEALHLSGERIRQMLAKEARRQTMRQKTVWYWYEIRQNLGRPVDMGGPRDVWLTYLPAPDPRLDNMVPV